MNRVFLIFFLLASLFCEGCGLAYSMFQEAISSNRNNAVNGYFYKSKSFYSYGASQVSCFQALLVTIAIVFFSSGMVYGQPAKEYPYMLRLDRTAYMDPVGISSPQVFSIDEAPVPVLGFLHPLRRLAHSFARTCFKAPGIELGMYLPPASWEGSPARMLLENKSSIVLVVGESAADLELARQHSQLFAYTKIGYDALIFFTHPDNPVKSLSLEQLRQIYSGKITNWKHLGGQDEEIKLFGHREIHYAQFRAFEAFCDLDISGLTVKKSYRQADSVGNVNTWRDDAEYDNSPYSLGFALQVSLLEPAPERDIKYLLLDGIAPTVDNIRSREYPAILPVYAVVLSSENKPNVLDFVKWMTEPQGQEILEKCGLVPLSPVN